MNHGIDVSALQAELHEATQTLRECGMSPEQARILDRIGAAADSLSDVTSMTQGSCELDEPYAEITLVHRHDGAWVLRCAHDPAHPDTPVRP